MQSRVFNIIKWRDIFIKSFNKKRYSKCSDFRIIGRRKKCNVCERRIRRINLIRPYFSFTYLLSKCVILGSCESVYVCSDFSRNSIIGISWCFAWTAWTYDFNKSTLREPDFFGENLSLNFFISFIFFCSFDHCWWLVSFSSLWLYVLTPWSVFKWVVHLLTDPLCL